MQIRKRDSRRFLIPHTAFVPFFGTCFITAQEAERPWMNTELSPEDRAGMVLKQLTLDEKLALSHGNRMANETPMAHAPYPSDKRWCGLAEIAEVYATLPKGEDESLKTISWMEASHTCAWRVADCNGLNRSKNIADV
jgi:hypothetical protein